MFIALSGDPFEVVGVFFSIGLSLLTLYAGFLAVRWMHKRIEAPKVSGHDLDELRDRMARLEEVEGRVADLEERVDFAERMLAQTQSQAALPPGERI